MSIQSLINQRIRRNSKLILEAKKDKSKSYNNLVLLAEELEFEQNILDINPITEVDLIHNIVHNISDSEILIPDDIKDQFQISYDSLGEIEDPDVRKQVEAEILGESAESELYSKKVKWIADNIHKICDHPNYDTFVFDGQLLICYDKDKQDLMTMKDEMIKYPSNLIGNRNSSLYQAWDGMSDIKWSKLSKEDKISLIYEGQKVLVINGGNKGEYGEVIKVEIDDHGEIIGDQIDIKLDNGKMVYLGLSDIQVVMKNIINEVNDQNIEIDFDGKDVSYVDNIKNIEFTGHMKKYHSGRSDEFEFEPDWFADDESEKFWDENWEDLSKLIEDRYANRNIKESKDLHDWIDSLDNIQKDQLKNDIDSETNSELFQQFKKISDQYNPVGMNESFTLSEFFKPYRDIIEAALKNPKMTKESLQKDDIVKIKDGMKNELVDLYNSSNGMSGMSDKDVNKEYIVVGFDGSNLRVREKGVKGGSFIEKNLNIDRFEKIGRLDQSTAYGEWSDKEIANIYRDLIAAGHSRSEAITTISIDATHDGPDYLDEEAIEEILKSEGVLESKGIDFDHNKLEELAQTLVDFFDYSTKKEVLTELENMEFDEEGKPTSDLSKLSKMLNATSDDGLNNVIRVYVNRRLLESKLNESKEELILDFESTRKQMEKQGATEEYINSWIDRERKFAEKNKKYYISAGSPGVGQFAYDVTKITDKGIFGKYNDRESTVYTPDSDFYESLQDAISFELLSEPYNGTKSQKIANIKLLIEPTIEKYDCKLEDISLVIVNSDTDKFDLKISGSDKNLEKIAHELNLDRTNQINESSYDSILQTQSRNITPDSFEKATSDSYGNSRYIIGWWKVGSSYEGALNAMKEFGGRKFHNKQFGGGIIFNVQEEGLSKLCKYINKKINKMNESSQKWEKVILVPKGSVGNAIKILDREMDNYFEIAAGRFFRFTDPKVVDKASNILKKFGVAGSVDEIDTSELKQIIQEFKLNQSLANYGFIAVGNLVDWMNNKNIDLDTANIEEIKNMAKPNDMFNIEDATNLVYQYGGNELANEFYKEYKGKNLNQSNSIFTLKDLENHIYKNTAEIAKNIKTYGFYNISDIDNYVDLSSLLGIDSRLLKDVDLEEYVETTNDIWHMNQSLNQSEKLDFIWTYSKSAESFMKTNLLDINTNNASLKEICKAIDDAYDDNGWKVRKSEEIDDIEVFEMIPPDGDESEMEYGFKGAKTKKDAEKAFKKSSFSKQ